MSPIKRMRRATCTSSETREDLRFSQLSTVDRPLVCLKGCQAAAPRLLSFLNIDPIAHDHCGDGRVERTPTNNYSIAQYPLFSITSLACFVAMTKTSKQQFGNRLPSPSTNGRPPPALMPPPSHDDGRCQQRGLQQPGQAHTGACSTHSHK